MRHALAVARLELREWRALPIVALALGGVPLLAWLILRERLAFEFVYTSVARAGFVLCALTTGAMALTRDLREGQALFLYTRPLASATPWLGRLASSLGATTLASLLYLLPGWYLHAGALPPSIEAQRTPLLSPGDALTAVWLAALGQWAALALAAGGWRRVVVDALAGSAFYVLTTWNVELLADDATVSSSMAMAVTNGLLAAPLLIAGVVQARRAPVDLERAYAVFSNANLAAMLATAALVRLCW